jgi:ribosomal protein S18 acetylase RimI-like enzyme
LSSAQTETKYLNSLEIERIYVLNNFKGIGIGTKLIYKAKEIALKHNLNFIWLGVWEKNTEAIVFYKKHGFNEFGNHVFMLGTDAQKDILMRLDF